MNPSQDPLSAPVPASPPVPGSPMPLAHTTTRACLAAFCRVPAWQGASRCPLRQRSRGWLGLDPALEKSICPHCLQPKGTRGDKTPLPDACNMPRVGQRGRARSSRACSQERGRWPQLGLHPAQGAKCCGQSSRLAMPKLRDRQACAARQGICVSLVLQGKKGSR